MEFSNNKLYLECDCGNEILVVESIIDPQGSEIINENTYREYYSQDFNFAIYQNNKCVNIKSIKNRLRIIFQVLFKGELWHDQIILSPDKVKELREFLYKELYKEKEKEIQLDKSVKKLKINL